MAAILSLSVLSEDSKHWLPSDALAEALEQAEQYESAIIILSDRATGKFSYHKARITDTEAFFLLHRIARDLMPAEVNQL